MDDGMNLASLRAMDGIFVDIPQSLQRPGGQGQYHHARTMVLFSFFFVPFFLPFRPFPPGPFFSSSFLFLFFPRLIFISLG